MMTFQMVNKSFYICIAYGLLTCSQAIGQFSLQGVVYDQLTGKYLPYASIIVTGRSAIGAVADSTGSFRVFLLHAFTDSEVSLNISRIGYKDTSLLMKVPLQGNLQIGLLPLWGELPAVEVSALSFKTKYTVGVEPSDRRFKDLMERRGFNSSSDSDIGLYFGHNDKGTIVIDSIQIHIPEWFKPNNGILVQCRESIADPKKNMAILGYPLGKELMSKPYVFFPLHAGWQTIRFTQERIVSQGRGVFIFLSFGNQRNKNNSGYFDQISWFKGRGDFPFNGFWYEYDPKRLMLFDKKMKLGHGFDNIYPGVLVHYRAAK